MTVTSIAFLILLFLTLFTLKLRHTVKPKILQFDIGESNNATHSKGLLSCIYDITKAEYYSDNVAIKSSNEIVKNPNYIYDICLSNADGNTTKLNENLKNMSDTVNSFVQSDEVWDRDDLITSIESIIDGKGNFVCLLAGKNTGKSLVLGKIEKRFPAKVYKVNLRIHPDILVGLLWTLRDRQMLNMKDKVTKIFADGASKVIKQYFGVDKVLTEEDFKKYMKIALAKRDPEDLQLVINNLVKNLGAITLVIDEANIALTVSEVTSNEEVKATKQALALFTTLTKEENKLNVILVSSEHVFPYRLRDPKVDFNLDNFNGYIYAGEVPPKDMYELLTTKFGVEHKVAVALINIYGGHIYDMTKALSRLQLKKEKFRQLFDSNLSSNVLKCLQWKFGKEKDNARMREVLRQLSVTGFVPLEDR